MRRMLVLLSLASLVVGSASFGLGLAACGGPDKPPLTPDTVDPSETADAGAPSTPPAIPKK